MAVPTPPSPAAGPPRLSVLVSVHHHDVLEQCLAALGGQRGVAFGDLEVVVVDGSGSRPWRWREDAVLRRMAPGLSFQVIEVEPCGRAAALNTALRHSRGRLLLFLADDFIADRRLVSRHLHFHERYPEDHRAAVGPAVFPEALRKKRFMRWLEESGLLFGVTFVRPGLQMPSRYFYAGNTSIKRALLERAGSFDERFPYDAWDDYEMGLRLARLGYKASYLPKATCLHLHRVTLGERIKQVRRGGRSAAIYDAHHEGEQAWHPMIRRGAVPESRWEHWKRLAHAWLRGCINRNDETWGEYYRLRLDAAFLEGYRLEVGGCRE